MRKLFWENMTKLPQKQNQKDCKTDRCKKGKKNMEKRREGKNSRQVWSGNGTDQKEQGDRD